MYRALDGTGADGTKRLGSAKEPKNAMVSLMTKSVPENGPPFGTPACMPLDDGLFEFRKESIAARRFVFCGSMVIPRTLSLYAFGRS
jgi:hypothetical protein